MKHMLLAALGLIATLLLPSVVSAQRPWIETLVSPVVHPDRTVTFAVKAPEAKKVELSAEFLKGNQALKPDTGGVWKITLGPVEPNLYPYFFVVDGFSVADPSNVSIFPNERFKRSLVDILGEEPAIYAIRDVPHGEVTYCYYHSQSMKTLRSLVVYTPPGYHAGQDRYPVFYLVSGTTDTEETWYRVGRANFILDNLIAEQEAVPMIVVMPYGNTMTGTPDPGSLDAAKMYKVFSDDLIGSIIPYVDARYRTIPNREKRAIAGFSRGGGQSLFAGFSNMDKFAWICSYSAFLTPEVFEKYFKDISADPETANKQLKLLWLGVGDEDFLYKRAVTFIDLLKEKKIEQKTLITSGGHTWMNARHYLTETAQLFFR